MFFSPADTPQKVDHIYRGRCFAYSRISSETQLFRLRKAVDAIFYFTTNQAALLPSEYTIDQPRFQANIPSNRRYTACNFHCTTVPLQSEQLSIDLLKATSNKFLKVSEASFNA